MTVGIRLDDGGFHPVADGDAVDLEFPVQGGHVLYIAAQVHNLEGRHAYLLARLRDSISNLIEAEDGRTVDFTVDAGGYGQPDLSDPANVANLPACPDYEARDVVNADWILEVRVTDSRDAGVTITHHVTPVCVQADPAARAACICECQANYFLGKCGGVDAG